VAITPASLSGEDISVWLMIRFLHSILVKSSDIQALVLPIEKDWPDAIVKLKHLAL